MLSLGSGLSPWAPLYRMSTGFFFSFFLTSSGENLGWAAFPLLKMSVSKHVAQSERLQFTVSLFFPVSFKRKQNWKTNKQTNKHGWFTYKGLPERRVWRRYFIHKALITAYLISEEKKLTDLYTLRPVTARVQADHKSKPESFHTETGLVLLIRLHQ